MSAVFFRVTRHAARVTKIRGSSAEFMGVLGVSRRFFDNPMCRTPLGLTAFGSWDPAETPFIICQRI